MCNRADYSLYYVLDLPVPGDPIELAEAAVNGGVTLVQLRGKQASGAELYELARALKWSLGPLEVPIIVNDRLDVALAAGADGVHLGSDDLPFDVVRKLAPDLILGVSCYGDIERARRAARCGVDYLAFGSYFPSLSKPNAPLAPRLVLREARDLGPPVVAIGGICRENAGEVIRAGADGVAVISAIQRADDPEEAARELRWTVDQELMERIRKAE